MSELKSGLIGHTGFVGGTLASCRSFDQAYNSRTIDNIRGHSFDHLVCAGVSAVKWLANKEPDADAAGIRKLTDALSEVQARRFTLISTIDVYPDPTAQVDETAELDGSINHAYGRHRLELERWVTRQFHNARIVRLPALFGPGLRKNALYDLINGNQVKAINPAGVFQWYPLKRLADDLDTIERSDARLVNLFPQPVAMSDIVSRFFPKSEVGQATLPAPVYRLETAHGKLFGATGRHRMSAVDVMADMKEFVESELRSLDTQPATV